MFHEFDGLSLIVGFVVGAVLVLSVLAIVAGARGPDSEDESY